MRLCVFRRTVADDGASAHGTIHAPRRYTPVDAEDAMNGEPQPFPEFLTPAFDEKELLELPHSICVIDPNGKILWVNRHWLEFAHENGADEASVRWRSYLDGIAPPLREYYEAAFARTLASGDVFEQDYECSSPGEKRLFHLRALPIDHKALLVEHVRVFEGTHEAEDIDEATANEFVDSRGLISQCSNCRRVRHPRSNGFHWVPHWVQSPHPKTSHVICPSCVGYYYRRRPRRTHQR